MGVTFLIMIHSHQFRRFAGYLGSQDNSVPSDPSCDTFDKYGLDTHWRSFQVFCSYNTRFETGPSAYGCSMILPMIEP